MRIEESEELEQEQKRLGAVVGLLGQAGRLLLFQTRSRDREM